MTSLELLTAKLKVSEKPGLEAFDDRFGAIGDHAQARRFAEASELFEELVQEEIYDLRLLVYFLYHNVDANRVEGVLGTLQVLNALFEKNWEAWGPANKREKVLAKSLGWLLENLNDLATYHLESSDSTWRLFSKRDDDQIDQLRDEFAKLSGHLIQPVWGTCKGQLTGFQRILEDEFNLLDPVLVEEESPVTEPKQADEVDSVISPRTAMSPGHDGAVELKASPQFFQLQSKLRAFEVLIEKEQFEKAAVVSNDVMQLITDFDPRQYFPELFAGFFGAMTRSIQRVRPHLENRDPMTWDTLEQFYKVDLDGFIKD